MFKKGLLVPFFCFSLFLVGHKAEENLEVSCNINVKKAIQCVSDKFLSISVDPAVLLAGVNLSENSLKLAKHLSPAFIRIAGPTTQFIKYVDQDDASHNLLTEDGNNVRITPSIWFGINEWLKLAKITPIYGINDKETIQGVWNPKSTLPLFDISEQLNISCYWQLGYDASNKNETRYKQDLNIFHYIMEAYASKNDTWKLVGSDISSLPSSDVENILTNVHDLTEAVMWEPSGLTVEEFPPKDTAFRILQHQGSKPRTKLWTTVPKSENTVTFSSAILWAKQIGNAAKIGYDVVFRQPRVHELFTDTPVYWCSLLHKKLMGCQVLETKSSLFQDDTNIFAHCTRKQNSFVRRGALTVMIVNDRPVKYKVKVKLGNGISEKSVEVQTYILTSKCLNSTQIYLNDEILTPEIFLKKNIFQPKIRRTKATSYILLSLPPSSIGFFVFPGARVPVCIEKEKETNLLLEEIEQDQNTALSEEVALLLGNRGKFTKHNYLEQITQNLKEEMKSDDNYYKSPSRFYATYSDTNEDFAENNSNNLEDKNKKHFFDRTKFGDKHKKAFDFEKKRDFFKKYLQEKSKTVKPTLKTGDKHTKMELSNDEIERLLKERAVERAAQKNIIFTDEELDALIRKASRSLHKSRHRRSVHHKMAKRDINMQLLEKYSQMDDNGHHHEHSKLSKHSQHHHHYHPNAKKCMLRRKKHIHRKRRATNVNLGDLKVKIAERKKFWDDKRDEILGNSLTFKENLKDKIRELKSNMRIKRDINMDLLDNSSSSKKKKNKVAKQTEAIEATIRESGQTSADILDELADVDVGEKEEKEHKTEVFAELADSEDLEEMELFDHDTDHSSNAPNRRKFKLFDNKKHKTDHFAIEHPTIDIVDPTRRRQKKKKSKADDKLQFLTTSEEFTDIEEDVPCIHEYFGTGFTSEKEGKKKGKKQIDDFYGRLRKKRSVDNGVNENNKIEDTKGNIDVAILKLEEEVPPLEDTLMLVDIPVIDKPITTAFQNLEAHVFEEALNNTVYETQASKPEHEDDNDSLSAKNIEQNEILKSSVNDKLDAAKEENSISNEIADTPHRKKRSTDEDFNKKKKEYKNAEDLHKKKKEHKKEKLDKKTEDKNPKKKHKATETLNEQMNHLKEKLQERKDEIDKIVHKQKYMEKEKKEQWKSKLRKKKRSHFFKPNIEIAWPDINTRFKSHHGKVKRSIFGTRKVFGNYQPVTSDLKAWKPVDIPALKRDIYKANSRKLLPPNDYQVFKNIFKTPYNIRKRRYIDTDVDIRENEIDSDINEIHKDKDILNMPEDDLLKSELPTSIEFDLLNVEKKTKPKKYDIYDFRSKSSKRKDGKNKDNDHGNVKADSNFDDKVKEIDPFHIEETKIAKLNKAHQSKEDAVDDPAHIVGEDKLDSHLESTKSANTKHENIEHFDIEPVAIFGPDVGTLDTIFENTASEETNKDNHNKDTLIFDPVDIFEQITSIDGDSVKTHTKHQKKQHHDIDPFDIFGLELIPLDIITNNLQSAEKHKQYHNKDSFMIDPANIFEQITGISDYNIKSAKTNTKHQNKQHGTIDPFDIFGPGVTTLDIIVENTEKNKENHNKETHMIDSEDIFGQGTLDIIINDQKLLPDILDVNNIETPFTHQDFPKENIEKHEENILDGFFKDDTYKVQLPNNDELDLIKRGEDTEIKLLHHDGQADDKNVGDKKEAIIEDISRLIPDIQSRFKPIESVDRVLSDVMNFFTNVGKHLDKYLRQFGIK
ncbi:uncharacterized protein LOC114333224 isoform X2 [Diabrotica virgifera virgifera]|uniref:Uncharacterized protein LOC114333224 isoform X2 n=1 Tax=Diabrotica virgifera virgifera TaxID=50390 RepID=A0A6P7G2Z7_DIAVI|nr:uncharacterized protein LOC114333224 isoform X2 [Diabrotica virgifera virgifera]